MLINGLLGFRFCSVKKPFVFFSLPTKVLFALETLHEALDK